MAPDTRDATWALAIEITNRVSNPEDNKLTILKAHPLGRFIA